MSRNRKSDQTLFSEPERVLDEEQKKDAGQMLGCGWSVKDSTTYYGLEEGPFRIQMGMLVSKREPQDTRHWSERGGAE